MSDSSQSRVTEVNAKRSVSTVRWLRGMRGRRGDDLIHEISILYSKGTHYYSKQYRVCTESRSVPKQFVRSGCAISLSGSRPHLNAHLLDIDSFDQRCCSADKDASGNRHRIHVAQALISKQLISPESENDRP